MKNRIIAVFLAFTVLFGSLSISKRAHAVAAVSWIITIGVAAWEILDIMIKGEEPGIIVAIRTLIEEGVDALTNPDSPFQQTYGHLWEDYGKSWDKICDQLQEMYNNGELVIENGQLKLTYDQYKQLYDITYSYVPNFGADFTTPFNYFGFSYTPGTPLPVLGLPTNDIYFRSDIGQSFFLCYYDNNKAVFSDNYIIYNVTSLGDRMVRGRYLGDNYHEYYNGFGFSGDEDYFIAHKIYFGYSSLSQFDYYFFYDSEFSRNSLSSSCFVLENGVMTYAPISSVDLTGCTPVIVSSTGDYAAFLQSITSVTAVEPVSAELSDLSDVLPVEKSPVLSIPTSPDLSVSIPDQVTVSVPGEVDAPLADYMNPAVIDVDVPSIILKKFPFCIPYDFVRFLSVLAADPVPPVFRIPISTHPKNLEQWADNETVGEFVAPGDPMFEIDKEIVIDFAHIPLVQPICYTVFIVGFVIMLIKLTPKLIQH